MLPMFITPVEVRDFVAIVDGRCCVCLLAETIAAVDNIAEIARVDGVDEIQIGLNDLNIERGTPFSSRLSSTGRRTAWRVRCARSASHSVLAVSPGPARASCRPK